MSETKCYYHPEKYAVTTCVTCKKDICRDDRIISTSRSSSKEYCIICYASYLKNMVLTTNIIIPNFLLVYSHAFIRINQANVRTNPSSSFAIQSIIVLAPIYLVFVAICVIITVYYYSKSKTATKNASEFEQSLTITKKNIQENKTVKCFKCASLLTPEDEFCSNCGMEIKKSI